MSPETVAAVGGLRLRGGEKQRQVVARLTVAGGKDLARGRLRVRSSGRITGNIRYGELEVEAGGRLRGDIQVIEMASGVTPMNPPVAAPRPAPTEVS